MEINIKDLITTGCINIPCLISGLSKDDLLEVFPYFYDKTQCKIIRALLLLPFKGKLTHAEHDYISGINFKFDSSEITKEEILDIVELKMINDKMYSSSFINLLLDFKILTDDMFLQFFEKFDKMYYNRIKLKGRLHSDIAKLSIDINSIEPDEFLKNHRKYFSKKLITFNNYSREAISTYRNEFDVHKISKRYLKYVIPSITDKDSHKIEIDDYLALFFNEYDCVVRGISGIDVSKCRNVLEKYIEKCIEVKSKYFLENKENYINKLRIIYSNESQNNRKSNNIANNIIRRYDDVDSHMLLFPRYGVNNSDYCMMADEFYNRYIKFCNILELPTKLKKVDLYLVGIKVRLSKDVSLATLDRFINYAFANTVSGNYAAATPNNISIVGGGVNTYYVLPSNNIRMNIIGNNGKDLIIYFKEPSEYKLEEQTEIYNIDSSKSMIETSKQIFDLFMDKRCAFPLSKDCFAAIDGKQSNVCYYKIC